MQPTGATGLMEEPRVHIQGIPVLEVHKVPVWVYGVQRTGVQERDNLSCEGVDIICEQIIERHGTNPTQAS